jgi:hypothetical protein
MMYHPSGYFSSNVQSNDPEDRPTDLSYPPGDEPDAEWALLSKHMLSYAGPVSVNYVDEGGEPGVTSGQLSHGPVEIALLPSWMNRTFLRNFTWYEDEDLLHLQLKNDATGEISKVFWSRLG